MFIPANTIKIGDKCVTTKELECFAGRFTEGTVVTITGIGDRGYDLVDDSGNTMIECGWNCVKKVEPESMSKNRIYIIVENGMVTEAYAESKDVDISIIDLDSDDPDQFEESQEDLRAIEKLFNEGKLTSIY